MSLQPSPSSSPHRTHALVAVAIAAAGWLAHASGFDHALASLAFDAAAADFPARHWDWLELIGHRLGKSAALVVWFALLAASIASRPLGGSTATRRALWVTTIGMGLGPAIVATLKVFTVPRCPWDLWAFGGLAPDVAGWFTNTVDAGRCFPSGHASAGFSMLALYFGGLALGNRRMARAGLWIGIAAGVAFSLVRMVQGAHFLSHNLWAAFVDWTVAAIVFAIAVRTPRAGLAAAPTRTMVPR